MTKSNVTVAHDGSNGRGYYCAGRRCAIKEQCHRYTSNIVEYDARVNDYDKLIKTKEKCKFFVDVNEANQIKG
jgi:predicted RNA-binding protein YlxR (DUF448 family)